MAALRTRMANLESYPIFEPSGTVDADGLFSELEGKLGQPLPGVYKDFVLAYGQTGFEQKVCAPIEKRFPLGDCVLVSVFFGAQPGRHYFLLDEWRGYSGDRMPVHMLPIATDPGGNLFCLSVGAHDYGKVYYWDREHVELPRGRSAEMADELEDEGVDIQQFFIDQIISEWERRHASELERPPGYGNLYLIADSFELFIDSLSPYVDLASE